AALTDWLGDPGRLVSYGCRFTRPVVVPDPGEVEVAVRGVVGAVDAEAGTARVDLTVSVDGATVLGKAQAHVRLACGGRSPAGPQVVVPSRSSTSTVTERAVPPSARVTAASAASRPMSAVGCTAVVSRTSPSQGR